MVGFAISPVWVALACSVASASARTMLADKASGFKSMADLKGHKVGVTRARTNDIVLTKNAVEGTTIQRYGDDASISQAMLEGQVDGIVTSDGLAVAMIGRDPKLESGFVVASATIGIGLPLVEADMPHWLNTDIFMLWTTAEIPARRKKWMGPPIPICPGSDFVVRQSRRRMMADQRRFPASMS